ncbi:MAG TPA: glycosyltransferase [Thermoanaerobaculia bacterium]|nr:glycosyltransferase [Thermoanaerobaculia bacterium]
MPERFARVAVVIPARNEERIIEHTVRAMLAQTYPALDVIVINDRSTDRTGAILNSLAAPNLVVVDGIEPPPGWLGKPWALAQGSARATNAEYLLFVDADVIYAPDAVAAMMARIEESGAAMLSVFPHFELHGFWEHVVMPNLAVAAFMFLPLWLGNRTRIPAIGAGGGPGNLIRRDVYDSFGGHEPLQGTVVDDIGLARLARKHGHRSEFVRGETMVSLRMYHGAREIIDGFTKNTFAVMQRSYVIAFIASVLAVTLHLVPYALAIARDPLGIATVATITVARLILFLSLGYRIDNALLGHPLMTIVWGWITLRSVWLTGVRRQVAWRGRTYDARKTR